MGMELSADITPEIIKAVSRRFVCRFLGKSYIFPVLLFIAFIFYMVWTSRANTWMTGTCGVFLVILVVFPLAMWRSVEKKGLDRFRRMPEPQMRFIFDERGVTFDSDLGTSTVSWLAIEKIWEFPEAWLLIFGDHQFLTVPCSILTQDVKSIIKMEVSKNIPNHEKVSRVSTR